MVTAVSARPTVVRRSVAAPRRQAPKWMQRITGTLSFCAPSVATRLLAYLFTRPRRQKLPRHERDWLLAARARPIRLSTGELVPLYEWRDQAPGQGVLDDAPLPTVLLVHGFGGRAGQMAGFAAPLVAAGYRVVAFDAPAHGAAAGRRSSLPEMRLAVQEVAAQLGPLAGVVAHSNGAAAVLVALSRGMQAQRLAFLAPMPDVEGFLQRLAAQLGFSQRVAKATQQRIEARYGLPFSALKAVNLLPQLSQTALILQDQDDPIVPLAEIEDLAQHWPGARLQVTRGLGHNRLLRDAASIAGVVSYLGAPQQP